MPVGLNGASLEDLRAVAVTTVEAGAVVVRVEEVGEMEEDEGSRDSAVG